jgi:hypothetical protein
MAVSEEGRAVPAITVTAIPSMVPMIVIAVFIGVTLTTTAAVVTLPSPSAK